MLVSAVAAALPELQAQAESLMVTPCVVARPTGVTADPVTGADVETSETVYDGYCKIQGRNNQVQTAESGLSTVAFQHLEVHLPVSSGPYRRGDVVDASGRRFRVLGVPGKTWQTAHRLPVEELT